MINDYFDDFFLAAIKVGFLCIHYEGAEGQGVKKRETKNTAFL